MKISIPEHSLVVLMGPFGSGKSTFAEKHFEPTEILSTNFCRGLVADDKENQDVTKDAYELLRFITAKRLKNGRVTVIDATNIQAEARRALIGLTRKFHCIPLAIVFDIDEETCQKRNENRTDRKVEPYVVRRQLQQLRHSVRNLRREGFRNVHFLRSQEEVEEVETQRENLLVNLKSEKGPFDIIGDIHGCFDETKLLLEKLDYNVSISTLENGRQHYDISHPKNRTPIFLGDLVDRGPKIPEVLNLVMDVVKSGKALIVSGNHEKKLARKLRGKEVQLSYGLKESVRQLEEGSKSFTEEVIEFIDNLPSHYVLDEGKLVVVHAGLKESMHGRSSPEVRSFAMYGERSRKKGKLRGVARMNWAKEYRGDAFVVYGHIPVGEATWINKTVSIDTGCVFGGKLTALQYPEKEVVSLPALKTYCFPPKFFATQLKTTLPPLASPDTKEDDEDEYEHSNEGEQEELETQEPEASNSLSEQSYSSEVNELSQTERENTNSSKRSEDFEETTVDKENFSEEQEEESFGDEKSAFSGEADDSNGERETENKAESEEEESANREPEDSHLYIEDVLGKRLLKTRFYHKVPIREEGTIAALEVLNRFSVHPNWLIYLPPTTAPCATSKRMELLEHPSDIFSYFHHSGVRRLICEEKVVGSRAVVILCKNPESAQKHFNTIGNLNEPWRIGVCYDRIGRPLLESSIEKTFLEHLQETVKASGLWEKLGADWICLDGVLSPKFQKDQDFLYQEYDALGHNAQLTYHKVLDALEKAQKQGARVQGLMKYYQERTEMVSNFNETFQKQLTEVKSLEDIQYTPFHLMASEGKVHFDKDHTWHLEHLSKLCKNQPKLNLLKELSYQLLDLENQDSYQKALKWWDEQVASGSAGAVIKSHSFIPAGKHWKTQPALECRSSEYLRLLYGPEYQLQKNLKRLSYRKLTGKRIQSLKEFALGLEALERFVGKKTFYQVHECIVGILALESEAVEICI